MSATERADPAERVPLLDDDSKSNRKPGPRKRANNGAVDLEQASDIQECDVEGCPMPKLQDQPFCEKHKGMDEKRERAHHATKLTFAACGVLLLALPVILLPPTGDEGTITNEGLQAHYPFWSNVHYGVALTAFLLTYYNFSCYLSWTWIFVLTAVQTLAFLTFTYLLWISARHSAHITPISYPYWFCAAMATSCVIGFFVPLYLIIQQTTRKDPLSAELHPSVAGELLPGAKVALSKTKAGGGRPGGGGGAVPRVERLSTADVQDWEKRKKHIKMMFLLYCRQIRVAERLERKVRARRFRRSMWVAITCFFLIVAAHFCAIFTHMWFTYATTPADKARYLMVFNLGFGAISSGGLIFALKADMERPSFTRHDYKLHIRDRVELCFCLYFAVASVNLFTSITNMSDFLAFEGTNLVLAIFKYPVRMHESVYKFLTSTPILNLAAFTPMEFDRQIICHNLYFNKLAQVIAYAAFILFFWFVHLTGSTLATVLFHFHDDDFNSVMNFILMSMAAEIFMALMADALTLWTSGFNPVDLAFKNTAKDGTFELAVLFCGAYVLTDMYMNFIVEHAHPVFYDHPVQEVHPLHAFTGAPHATVGPQLPLPTLAPH